jgi:hypothetical protein
MSAQNPSPVTPLQGGIYGEIVVDLDSRIDVEGTPEPVVVWRIPVTHVQAIANGLASIDAAREALNAFGDATFHYYDEEVRGLLDALHLFEGAELIWLDPVNDGWYSLVRTCRVCRCTDVRACDPPCSWASADLCSTCAESLGGDPEDEPLATTRSTQ